MSRTQPLTKARLHQLLKIYQGRVTMEEVGGYDWGIYFQFKGKMREECHGSPRIVAGRIVGKLGFSSEALCITRGELLCRDSKAGLDSFWRRVSARRSALERWLEAFYAASTETPCNE